MKDAKSQLLKLRKIQDLVIALQEARAVVESAPGRLEQIEGEFRARNAEYVQAKDRYEELERDRMARSVELQELDAAKKKFMDSLMQVKNQREYAAVLKEIDTVKARIGEHEETLLKSMEEIETLKEDLESRAAHIEGERQIVEAERAKVEAEVVAAEARIREVESERSRIEAELPSGLVATVKRIEENRRGIFLVRAEREMCTACHVRIRPQVFQEIKNAVRIHACSNCRRILYEESLTRTAASGPAPEPGVSGMEAMNGGAV